MKKIIGFYFFTIASCISCIAQTVTWSEDIACIIYSHCNRCHNNTSAVGAIPYTNYNEVFAQRYAINYYVSIKSMPPYFPDTEKTRYMHEKSLTEQEIKLINKWVEIGCPKGDISKEPPTPVIKPFLSKIASPDFSKRITPYKVPDIQGFQYRCFVYPTKYPVEKYISQLEVLPTDLSAIYSVFVYSDTSSIPLKLDKEDPGNGYANYSGTGSPTSKLLYGWVNGNPLYNSPQGMALQLDANAHIIIRILFAEDAQNKMDSTQVNIKFDISGSNRIINTATLLSHTSNLQNPPFFIPADSIRTFYEEYTVPSDVSLLGISPCGHKLCVRMGCFAVTPGNDTLHLMDIENHEDLFSEGMYYFDKPKKIPLGSILYAYATYDNTENNYNNPFSPPHNIVAGITDTSESMEYSFAFLPYKTKDENILIDTLLHLSHYLDCNPAHSVSGIKGINNTGILIFPNPVSNSFSIQFSNGPQSATVYIISITGKVVEKQTIINGSSTEFDISGLTSGAYYLRIMNDIEVRNVKLLKL